MTLALNPELPKELLSNLIVADIAPSRGDLSPEFQEYIEAMKRIVRSNVSTRKEAQEILSEYESVCFLPHFLELLVLSTWIRIPTFERFC
jgi:hypothetical protein